MDTVMLKPMTQSLYHTFFQGYENDPDLYLEPGEFAPYVYDRAKVDAYIQRQENLGRLPFAIFHGEEMVGELKFYNVEAGCSTWLGITLQRSCYKDRGFGTEAERLAVEYAFHTLGLSVLYADSIRTNLRSQHVLEKVGFALTREDEERKYYVIRKL